MIEIRLHGRGGQGAVTAVELMARGAIDQGYCAQAFPSFGPERRGAPVTAYLRISQDPIRLREEIETPDVVVVLDPSLIGFVDVCKGLKKDGIMVVNCTGERGAEIIRKSDRRMAVVDASQIALDSLGVPIVNTAIIGALLKATDIMDPGALAEPLTDRFGKLADKNIDAMQRAYAATVIHEGSLPMNKACPAICELSYEEGIRASALRAWDELEPGCDIVRPGSSSAFFTGNWRTTGKPVMDPEKCSKCGLCWILCPDMAYSVDDDGFYRLDERYCKGCGICAEICPKGAIEMREHQ
jgi:pyruvate ferredoxin oxidoreductase gamma subunit